MLLICIVSFVALLLDQVSKLLVTGFGSGFSGLLTQQGQTVTLIPRVFSFTFVLNKGAAFGILQNQRIFFLLATVVACFIGVIALLHIKKKHFLLKLSSGFLFGGGIGNLIDRVVLGYVRDFLDATFVETLTGYSFPVFNVADMFVVVGVILLAWYVVFIHDNYTKEEKDEADGDK